MVNYCYSEVNNLMELLEYRSKQPLEIVGSTQTHGFVRIEFK